MTTTTHRLIDEYLHRLDRAGRVLPRRDRTELLAEIRSHLDAGLPPQATEADIRNLLDELGPPDSIVAAARPDRRAPRRGLRELFALLLLVLGLPPVVGWLAGVGLLLSSPLWSIRQKLLGILVWPGGYGILFGLGFIGGTASCPMPADTSTSCVVTGPSLGSVIALIGLAAAPLVVATYLYWAAGRATESA
jgi:hypothetical protein